MHPAPGVHNLRAGCMIFKDVHPDCAHFSSHLSLLHIRRVHREVPGCTVLGGVHPAGAQFKSLISDTAKSECTIKIIVECVVYKHFS